MNNGFKITNSPTILLVDKIDGSQSVFSATILNFPAMSPIAGMDYNRQVFFGRNFQLSYKDFFLDISGR